MGNSQNSVNIILDRPQPSIFYTGEFVSGRVQVVLSERTEGLNSVYLTLFGDAAFNRTRVGRIMNGQNETFTDRYDVRILNKGIVLKSPIRMSTNDQFFGPDVNNDSNGAIGPGHYQFPFSIRLPDVLPPTLHPEECPFVRYALEIFVEKRWYIPDTTRQCSIRIYPKVDLFDIPNIQSALKFHKTEKNITVKGLLPRAGFIAGEKTNFSLQISNPNRIGIKTVQVCLIQHFGIDQCRRRAEIFQVTVPNLFDCNDENIQVQCPIDFPIGIAPTYAFSSKADASGFQVDVFYDLKFVFKLRKFFSDFDILVPLVIGTKMLDNNANHRATTNLPAFSPMHQMIDQRNADRNDPPPSYESLNMKNLSIEPEYYE